jgi:CRISPR-associated exonuclease Cas4
MQGKKQEFSAPGMKIDLLTRRDGNLIVQEVKKSSKNLTPGRMQLAYYIHRLRGMGIEARGELLIPKERKRIPVELTPELDREVRETLVEIKRIITRETPPSPVHSLFCRNCAYAEFCWGVNLVKPPIYISSEGKPQSGYLVLRQAEHYLDQTEWLWRSGSRGLLHISLAFQYGRGVLVRTCTALLTRLKLRYEEK